MGSSLSLKYNLPNSLHCELTWHMLDRDALGHQHCLSGFFPACQMHVEGKGQLQSPGKKKKKQRIHVIMDAHMTLSQASQWKKTWQLNDWSILSWGGKSRHFLWQWELWCLKIVSSVAKSSLFLCNGYYKPLKPSWKCFWVTEFADFQQVKFLLWFWLGEVNRSQVVRLNLILCSPITMGSLSKVLRNI